ncbi:MAG: sodium:solute symporter, partial [Bacteroidales bacterium]|nr:sodium:solute symporter [Bacteroidales bacterium]
MSPTIIFLVFLIYTALLFLIAWITSRRADNETFFTANRSSPWFVVAYGMIGASLSGVTFISVPGWVGSTQFSYLVVVLGYILGYYAIAFILLPLYYRLKLISIYTYLESRFGFYSYKTGSLFFLISRTIGASLRLFLVVNVLQVFVFDEWGIPFYATTALFIILIWLYTVRGGIKTIVWTDTLQTTFMLLSLVITIFLISDALGFTFSELFKQVKESEYSKVFYFTEWQDKRYFLKQFLSGIFIAIVMTGLDQDMMQKNLTCKTLRDAQKNVITLGWILIPVNIIFLIMGASLYIYATNTGVSIPSLTDNFFPQIAFNHLSVLAGLTFFIGLMSAAYSSADSAITALTTSFSVDFLGIKRRNLDEKKANKSGFHSRSTFKLSRSKWHGIGN